MVEFKLVLSDPKTGKSYQKEVKEAQAGGFLGKKVGEAIKGESIDLTGYELEITGGSDSCGFPMRKGINVPRKKVLGKNSVGVKKHKFKGTFKKKTVCGKTIAENISQINLKVTKEGKKKLADEFGAKEEAPKEEAKKEEKPKEAPKKEAKKEEPKKKETPKKEEKKEE
jgi:small subunit ribosomal protein S6e